MQGVSSWFRKYGQTGSASLQRDCPPRLCSYGLLVCWRLSNLNVAETDWTNTGGAALPFGTYAIVQVSLCEKHGTDVANLKELRDPHPSSGTDLLFLFSSQFDSNKFLCKVCSLWFHRIEFKRAYRKLSIWVSILWSVLLGGIIGGLEVLLVFVLRVSIPSITFDKLVNKSASN